MTDDPNPAAGAPQPRETSEARWKTEYERQIRALGLECGDASAGRHAERRQFPRLAFPPGALVYVHGDPRAYAIRDISAGGLSFYSHHALPRGARVLLSAMDLLALQVEVLGCEMEEFDADFLDYRYRVRARFTEDVNGYQAFVLAREIYAQAKAPGKAGDPSRP